MKRLRYAIRQSRIARAGYRTAHFLRTGHWPRKFRYPHGIPRISVWDIEPFNNHRRDR